MYISWMIIYNKCTINITFLKTDLNKDSNVFIHLHHDHDRSFPYLHDHAVGSRSGETDHRICFIVKPYANPGIISTRDRKSTRLNSSHVAMSYAVFCLKKKNK